MAWLNSLDSVSTIRALRKQASQIQTQELEAALQKLKNGGKPEQILQQVTRNLTNKLIHNPSKQLRQASADGRQDLNQATLELFDLLTAVHSEKDSGK